MKAGDYLPPGWLSCGAADPPQQGLSAAMIRIDGMNIKPLGVFAAITLASISLATAAPKAYQVTGPVLEVNESTIVVQKGNERWEIARDAKTKAGGDVKVSDRVTIHYWMTAKEIELKGDKGAQSGAKASESPATKK